MNNNYLIDSHSHLHDPEFFSPDLAEKMLARAAEAGVCQIICIGTSDSDSKNARAFAESHKNVFWTYGIHPEEANEIFEGDFSFLSSVSLTEMKGGVRFDSIGEVALGAQATVEPSPKRASGCGAPEPVSDLTRNAYELMESNRQRPKLVGIGEVGLDYHYENFDRPAQIRLLEEMLDLATELNLPVSLHVRDAFPDIFGVLANFPNLTGVFHSFSDSEENLKKVIEKGFYVGINGLATFANLACFKNLGQIVPLDRILLETDAPFLTPVPKRGIINESAYIKYIAEWLSAKLGISLEEITEKTTENVRTLFNLPYPELLKG